MFHRVTIYDNEKQMKEGLSDVNVMIYRPKKTKQARAWAFWASDVTPYKAHKITKRRGRPPIPKPSEIPIVDASTIEDSIQKSEEEGTSTPGPKRPTIHRRSSYNPNVVMIKENLFGKQVDIGLCTHKPMSKTGDDYKMLIDDDVKQILSGHQMVINSKIGKLPIVKKLTNGYLLVPGSEHGKGIYS